MDKTTAIVIGFGLLVVAFIAFFFVFRKQGKGKIKGPWGMGLEVEGRNDPVRQPGAMLEDAKGDGNIRVQDASGQGAVGKKLRAGGDIEVSNTGGPAPKK